MALPAGDFASGGPASSDAVLTASSLPCGLDSAGQPYGFSGFALQRERPPAWAVVGQGYIVRQKQTAGDWVRFTFAQDSGQGDFSQGYPRSYTSAWFRTEFSMGQYRGECHGQPGQRVPRIRQHAQCPRTYLNTFVRECLWMLINTGWFGGAGWVHPGQVPDTPGRYCAPHEQGSFFESDFGVVTKWASEASPRPAPKVRNLISMKASLNGSGHRGIHAAMYFGFGRAGFLCGTNGTEAKTAVLVQRGSKP
ncbi:MAG TPA: hypothetical protein VFQ44_23580 [Streptosporangiaceae bacterium]|nr:hypothetical protein [Streptosporangiaceae bacterium]